MEQANKLYVGNLDFTTTEDERNEILKRTGQMALTKRRNLTEEEFKVIIVEVKKEH